MTDLSLGSGVALGLTACAVAGVACYSLHLALSDVPPAERPDVLLAYASVVTAARGT